MLTPFCFSFNKPFINLCETELYVGCFPIVFKKIFEFDEYLLTLGIFLITIFLTDLEICF